MNLEEAKQIISQAINAALLKGCYSLDDVKLIIKALDENDKSVSFEIVKDES